MTSSTIFDRLYNNIDKGKVPEEIKHKIKLCLIDTIGSIIIGHLSKSGQIAIRFVKKISSNCSSSIIGTQTKVDTIFAAYANATLASAFDIDDGSLLALGHPGAAVIPATLSAAETSNSSGERIVKAILLGYEVAIITGFILNSKPELTFYGSGSWASSGAAAATSYLLGLDKAGILNAIGIADAYAPISPVMRSIKDGAMVKESMGWAALTGLSASFLSQEGFRGITPNIADCSSLFSNEIDSYQTSSVYFKKYMCCRWSHAAVDGVIQLMQHEKIEYPKIKKVIIGTHSKGYRLNAEKIKTIEGAQYSLPFVVAAAICDNEVGPNQITTERFNDQKLLNLISKIVLKIDPKIDEMFPKYNSANVSIVMLDGTKYEIFIKNAKGSPNNPFNDDDVLDKFSWLVSAFLTKNQIDQLVDMIWNIESLSNIQNIIHQLACIKAKI